MEPTNELKSSLDSKDDLDENIFKTILEFQPDTVEIEHAQILGHSIVLHIVLFMLVVSVFWAYLSEVDRVVIAPGKLLSIDKKINIQPFTASMIKKVHVEIGQKVKQGDPIITLDTTVAKSELDIIQDRLKNIRATIKRLEQEQKKQGCEIEIEINKHDLLQQKLCFQRDREYNSKIKKNSQQIDELQSNIRNYKAQNENLIKRLEISRQIYLANKNLNESQDISNISRLDAENKYLLQQSEQHQLYQKIHQDEYKVQNLLTEKEVYTANWNSVITTDLNKATGDYLEYRSREKKALMTVNLTTLRTPIDGIIFQISDIALGSIVREAESLVKILPIDFDLEVDVNIPAQYVGSVRIGDSVKVKLASFPFQKHGSLKGEVRNISGDTLEENRSSQQPQPKYYKARIRILEKTLKDVPDDFILIPGMEASSEIRIGKRRVIDYLIYPIIRATGESMREP